MYDNSQYLEEELCISAVPAQQLPFGEKTLRFKNSLTSSVFSLFDKRADKISVTISYTLRMPTGFLGWGGVEYTEHHTRIDDIFPGHIRTEILPANTVAYSLTISKPVITAGFRHADLSCRYDTQHDPHLATRGLNVCFKVTDRGLLVMPAEHCLPATGGFYDALRMLSDERRDWQAYAPC